MDGSIVDSITSIFEAELEALRAENERLTDYAKDVERHGVDGISQFDRAEQAEADLRALAPLVEAAAKYVRTTPTHILPRIGSSESVSQNAKDELEAVLASIPDGLMERVKGSHA